MKTLEKSATSLINKKKVDFHQPALLKETIEFLNVKKGNLYIDCTLGGGGHTLAILQKGGLVLGIDCDQEALDYARMRLQSVCPAPKKKIWSFEDAKWLVTKGNFAHLKIIWKRYKLSRPAGILFDLGVSSYQLSQERRGFSFLSQEEPDMRMDKDLKVRAVDLIKCLNQGELTELFRKYGEEKFSREIAKEIILARNSNRELSCSYLAQIVQGIYKKKYSSKSKIHPATKVFLALRIAVNDELNNLRKGLEQARDILAEEGRIVVISFHSLEDKIVKDFFKKEEIKGCLKIITKKPVVPTKEEKEKNIRVRSAKLRCSQKV